MKDQYQIIHCEYPVTDEEFTVFSNLNLMIGLFARKNLCEHESEDILTRLIPKEQKNLDRVVIDTLSKLSLTVGEEQAQKKPLLLLSQVLDKLEKTLKKKYPVGNEIEFGNFAIEGFLEVAEVLTVQERHEELILEILKKQITVEFEDDSDEAFFNYLFE
ncbi:hypothetical protein [Enterococcus sp. DIV0187]|uniref:hypothetical protein n=1 Tax=Enterococcus sp. DIV0187 TaxID=2774644 RepID=UPI003F1FA4F8